MEHVLLDNLEELDDVLLRRMADALNSGPVPPPVMSQYDQEMETLFRFESLSIEAEVETGFSLAVKEWLGQVLRAWVTLVLAQAEQHAN